MVSSARSLLILALAVAVSAETECTTAACTAEDNVDEVHEVSLLQTDTHMKKSPVKEYLAEIKQHVHINDGSSSSDGAGGFIWLVVALALLAATGMLAKSAGNGEIATHKYVAEFVGTFMLIFSVGCNVIVGDATFGVTAIAMTLMVSIYAFGGVSGANFNPAVSVALGLTNKMEWTEVACYCCVQSAAALCAGLAYVMLLGKSFDLAPKGTHSLLEAGLAELFYTFMLTFVVLNTAASKAHAGKNQFYGVAIAFTVIAGGYGAGSVSGGCFNPAVALGIDSSSTGKFGMCLAYWAFELAGCALAAILFKVCRPEDSTDAPSDGTVPMSSKLTSEFIGTFMLILTVGLNVTGKSKAGAFSIAASLMSMIFALGSVSGAHFNPAVTVALLCAGRGVIDAKDAILYMAAQIAGGLCAATAYTIMMHDTVALAPNATASIQQALAGELIFTFLLCLVVLCVATIKNSLSEYFGFAIGACVIAGGYSIGNLSGGSLNPAVSVALAVTSTFGPGAGNLSSLLPYITVEVLGGVLAASVFAATHVDEYAKA